MTVRAVKLRVFRRVYGSVLSKTGRREKKKNEHIVSHWRIGEDRDKKNRGLSRQTTKYSKSTHRRSGQVLLFEGRYPLCRDSTGGASGLASAAIDTSGFVDLALVAILRNGFDRTRRHASAATDADSFINLMRHFELLLCMDEKRNASPGSSPSSYAGIVAD